MDTQAEITVSGLGRGSLKVGGIDISSLTAGLELRVRPGEITELIVTMHPRAVTATGDVAVVLPEDLHALLIELGWTPPAPAPAEALAEERN